METAYGKISSTYYQEGNRFGSFSLSHNAAFEQIEKLFSEEKFPEKVLDLGVGNGAFLSRLAAIFPETELTGVDISKDMLNLTKQRLPKVNLLQAKASEAVVHFPASSQCLVLAHFINAYVPIQVLAKQAQVLLKEGSYFSFVTSTEESFAELREKSEAYISRKKSMPEVAFAHFYKVVLRKTLVPKNFAEISALLALMDLQVVARTRLELPVEFKTVEDFCDFGVKGSWFINSLSIPFIPNRIIEAGFRFFSKRVLQFPCQTRHVIGVVLAKKSSS